VTQNSTRLTPQNAVTLGQSRARREQLIALAVAAVLLGLILLLQPILTARRAAIVPPTEATARQLAVEFPKLTLGGFRGFLAMYLWQEAEEDKNERRWVELETKYNYIGQLEPYFVTVYVYNAWNEAYNLSAQWHGIDEKFKWVLDGLAHLYVGEGHNPDNPDLLLEESQMYFLKLGTSFERIDYRKMWRDRIRHQYLLGKTADASETRALETHQRVRNIIMRPYFNATLLPKDDQHPNELGYGISVTGLFPDKPHRAVEFRYGVSPFYFAFVEYQRMRATGRPTTMGYQVVDAYGGMSLRLWCHDDLYYANSVVAEIFADGAPGAAMPRDFNDRVFEIRDCYRNVQMNAPHALDEFEAHLQRFPTNRGIHRKHMLETEFMAAIGAAEGKMFDGLVAWQVAKREMTPAVQQELERSLPLYDKAIASITRYMDEILPTRNGQVHPDRADYEKLATAMRARSAGVRALVASEPGATVDMKWLQLAPVER